MEIIQQKTYRIIRVTVEGRTPEELTRELEAVTEKIAEGNDRWLLLDLGALKYLGSSVLRMILAAVKEIDRKNGKVVLCSLNVYVKEIFEGSSNIDSLAISESVDSGLKTLLRPLKAA